MEPRLFLMVKHILWVIGFKKVAVRLGCQIILFITEGVAAALGTCAYEHVCLCVASIQTYDFPAAAAWAWVCV